MIKDSVGVGPDDCPPSPAGSPWPASASPLFVLGCSVRKAVLSLVIDVRTPLHCPLSTWPSPSPLTFAYRLPLCFTRRDSTFSPAVIEHRGHWSSGKTYHWSSFSSLSI